MAAASVSCSSAAEEDEKSNSFKSPLPESVKSCKAPIRE